MAEEAPMPILIRQIECGVYPAFAMRAGVQLDLFTALKDERLPAEALAVALGVHVRHLQPLLDNLASAGLLTVADGGYANTEEAGHFLVRGEPAYMGATFDLWSDFWHAIGHTTTTIRMGMPQAEHDYSHMTEDEQGAWLRDLHPDAVRVGKALTSRYDFTACRSILDVGGGLGGLSVMLARAYPALHATVLDLPTVTSLAARFFADEGMTDRIDTLSVDLLRDAPVGQYDAAVLMRFIQCFGVEDARAALRNIAAALHPGGMIVIVGSILDDSRLTPVRAVHVNLVFLNIYDGGRSYTEGEYRQWLVEAGFTDVRRDEPINGMGIIVARKA